MKQKPSTWEALRDGTVRTYGDLIRICRPSSSRGNCCACHEYDRPTWQLSTRASICQKCCERKEFEVLGSIATAERKARRYARELVKNPDPDRSTPNIQFYARLAGVSEQFMEDAIAQASRV